MTPVGALWWTVVTYRQIAGKLTGRVTKWLVLVFWILVVAVAGPLAGKLTDVQDNQASSWLPASAESTKALDKLAPFQNENDVPTVVVYEKSAGLTKADLAAIGDQLDQIQGLDGAVPPISMEVLFPSRPAG